MEVQSSRIPQLKTFLFCFSLLTGSKIIGYIKAIVQLIFGISLFSYYVIATSRIERVLFAGVLVTVTTLAFIEAFFAVILLHGLIKRKPAYVKIWIVIQLAIMIQNMASLLTYGILNVINYVMFHYFFQYKTSVYVFFNIIGDIYCTLVVYSYYRDEYYRDRSGNIISADLLDTLE